MADGLYVVLSAAMSADGYIDDATDQRLVLSDAADLDRVDAVRASCDAILVGARTVRRDNPGLRVKSADRRADRERRGLPGCPVRVTITGGGDLHPAARFFAADGIDKLVYAPAAVASGLRQRLGMAATVIDAGARVALPWLLADLASRGVRRLMVEGGSTILGQFLAAGLADELQLAIAPVFVADAAAPRLACPAGQPGEPGLAELRLAELRLTELSQAGRMAVLRYRSPDNHSESG